MVADSLRRRDFDRELEVTDDEVDWVVRSRLDFRQHHFGLS
jgi:hypothetical protein